MQDPKNQEYDPMLFQPYWTNVNVYYDITSSQDIIMLVYKDLGWEQRTPIVRFQSESLLDRFPLKHTDYKNNYKEALMQSANNGYGIIVIFYHDGLGHGFGNQVLNKNISQEMRNKLGVSKDIRDYNAASLLLKE